MTPDGAGGPGSRRSEVDVAGHGGAGESVFRGIEGLEALRDDWFRLLERGAQGGYSVSYSCYEALLRYRHPQPERVRFFCVRGADGEVRAICPLEVKTQRIRRLPFRAWQFPADPDRPCSAFVVDPGFPTAGILPGLLSLIRAASPGVGLALFERVEVAAPTWDAIGAAGLACREHTRPPLFRLPMGEPAEALLARASKKFRFNIHWGRRRMEKLGALEHRVARDPAQLGPALDAFLALEASGWKGHSDAGRAIRLRPEVERHARGLVALAGARGECEIHGLWLEDRCVASLVGLAGPGELFVFKIARDESFAAFSLGHLMVASVIDHGRPRSDVAALNFGWEAAWMRPWGGRLDEVGDLDVSLGGFKGGMAMGLLGRC
jgi:CelD/BcsL family acetyltransferase involved in cellulose biosynthesis